MEETEVAPFASPRRALELEPFDFYPNRRSALGGFGGEDGHSDPTYAFHTQYQPSAPGRITFSVTLTDLAATTGTLVLRVLALPADSNAIEPVVINTAPIALRTLAERGGEVSIAVRATGTMLYALAGLMVEESDATLSGIAIALDRLDHGETDAGGMAESEHTRFDAASLIPIAMLLTSTPPTLVRPVSQVLTDAQYRDPHFTRWARDIGAAADADGWSRVYPLRVLESYGVLAPGAHGLLLGDADEAMAGAVLARGGTLEAHRLEPAPDGAPTPVPEGLRGFDFLCSRGLCDTLPSIADGLHLIDQSLACLNVGGLAIHVFRFVATGDGEGADVPGSLVYNRGQLERLALHLIGGNHELAQFSYHLTTGYRPRPTRFGLIVRKGSF